MIGIKTTQEGFVCHFKGHTLATFRRHEDAWKFANENRVSRVYHRTVRRVSTIKLAAR